MRNLDKHAKKTKPRLGQGRVGIREMAKVQAAPQLSNLIQSTGTEIIQHPQNTAQPAISSDTRPQTKCIPEPQTRFEEKLKAKINNRDIPPYPDAIYRPLPRPPDKPL